MRASLRLALAIVVPLCGCKSKPPPPAEPAPDHAKECREGNEDACAKACLGGDPSFCKEAIWKRAADAWKDEKSYMELLDQACKNGEIEMCEELGGMLLGRDKGRAISAYERACAGPDAGGADCLATRKQWIEDVEAAQPKCEAGDIGACVDLGAKLMEAQSDDAAVEAFARACELRGLDNEKLFLVDRRPDCQTGETFYPRYPHPGGRGRCAIEISYAVRSQPNKAREVFNVSPYLSADVSADAGAPAPSPDKPKGRLQKLLREPVRVLGGEYPVDKLAPELDAMHERFSYCTTESPELKGQYSFAWTFTIDRFGTPAFLYSGPVVDRGYASGAPYYRVIHCIESILKNHKYTPPPSGKGATVFQVFTVNPDAPMMKRPTY